MFSCVVRACRIPCFSLDLTPCQFFLSLWVLKSRQKHNGAEEFHTDFYSLLPPSVFTSVPLQDTRSPTVWTAGTRSAGPRWRWAPMVDSSPSRGFPLSRHTCSDSSLARPWAGVNNWKRWLLPQSEEVSLTLLSYLSHSKCLMIIS